MSNQQSTEKDIQPIVDVNANWISIVPYGFLKNDEVLFDSDYQWEGERPEGIKKTIRLAKELGLKVMIKPHIWIGFGAYTGTYVAASEEGWQKLEKTYAAYILAYAEMAEKEGVEMLCVGTEWGAFVKERSDFWELLIKDVRKVYSGRLIYAANWDDYHKVPFWTKLDYIGIDSYFPLSKGPNPNFQELIESWKSIVPILEQFSSGVKKDVVFTEFGFKSSTHGTIAPWEHKDVGKYSAKVQNLAFKSYFNTIWKKPWFKGGFVWKWFHNHKKAGGRGDKDFTPQNKPAEETIRQFYGKG